MPELPKSVAVASMHKAGSSIAQTLVGAICREAGMTAELLESQAWAGGVDIAGHCLAADAGLEPRGRFYGVLRGPYVARMPRLAGLKLIVLVRDPRDCITSLYYSMAQSHTAPKDPAARARLEALRARLAGMDVDAFALAYPTLSPDLVDYAERMAVLRRLVETHPDCRTVTYERMVAAPEAWLGEVGAFLGHPPDPALLGRLGALAAFEPPPEDPGRHRRQVRPGDHRRKLAPATVAALTARLKDGLDFFGYADTAAATSPVPQDVPQDG